MVLRAILPRKCLANQLDFSKNSAGIGIFLGQRIPSLLGDFFFLVRCREESRLTEVWCLLSGERLFGMG